MEIAVKRVKSNKEETLGELYINGAFECYTLEDEKREVKVMGETRIPPGTYQIKFRKIGGHHARYAAKYGTQHKGMLWLQNVPNFQYILIHAGNTDADTAGCLLVGAGYLESGGVITLTSSRKAYEKMYPKVSEAILAGEEVFITIFDAD